MFGRIQALVVNRRLVPEAAADLASWAAAVENRRLRREALGRALGSLRTRTDRLDLLMTAPLCELYFADLLHEIDGDRGEDNHSRNAERLVAAWTAAASCLDRSRLTDVTDRVVAAAAANTAAPVEVLGALGGLAGRIALTALDGRGGDLPAVLGEVVTALRRVREGLGNTRDERILHAALGVYAGTAELFRGRADLALQEVGTAADLLDHLVTEGESGLERPSRKSESPSCIEGFAPALRGGSLVALALLQWLTDQGGLAAGTLQRLDATAEGDLSALFRALEVRDHSAAIVRIIHGLVRISEKNWTEAAAALQEASPQGPGETGWWAVGLDAGRLAAWDLLAILAWEAAPDTGRAALGRAEDLARRLVDDGMDHFQARGTGWEFFSILPLVHEVVPGLIGEEIDWKALLRDLAAAVEPALKEALTRIPNQFREPACRTDPALRRAPGFTDLLLDALRDATEVGLVTLLDQGVDALPRLADLLESRLDEYDGELRFILGILAGTARFFGSPEAASEVFRAAGSAAPDSMAGVSWLPLLLDGAFRLRVADDRSAALSRLDEVLAEGERAASCDVDDPVHALLPARMWLREVTGDGDAATEDYHAFRRMAARGFPGHATLSCRLASQRGGLTVNVQVSQSLAAFFLPAGAEGSFDVGAGWTSESRDVDEVHCQAAVSAGPRDDAIMHAHLVAAFYAMRRGDDAAAHRALTDAAAAGRRLVSGSESILGAAASAAVDAAREAVSTELMAWVSFVARVRGHISAADHLADQAAWILERRGTTWDEVLPEGHPPPVFLAFRPELSPLGPHVRAWHLASDHAARAVAMRALVKDRRLTRSLQLPKWGIRLVRELQEISAAGAAGEPMQALSGPPKDPRGRAVVRAWSWVVSLWKAPASFSLKDFSENADALAGAGLHRETVGVAATVAALLRGTRAAGMVGAVLAAAADRIPRDTFPVARAAVLGELAPTLMQGNDLRQALGAYVELVPALSGRVDTRTELENRLNLVNLLGAAELVPDLSREVRALLPMLERRFGRREEVFHSLLSVDVALRLFQNADVPPDAAIDALVKAADSVRGAAPAKQFFRIVAAGGDLEARSRVSVEYLRFMFLNGPPLQEPSAPSGRP